MPNYFYNANPNLKAAGVQINFSAEELEEYVRCKEDPIYFIEKYCKVISLDHGIVPFKLYEYQKRIITSIHENRKIIAKLFRQGGKTTTVAAYICHYILFNDAKTVAILANKATAAREVLYRLQLMYEYLPKFLQQGVIEWNKGSITLENKSKVFTSATSSSGIRGKSVNFLYIDEFAIIANTIAEEFLTSTYPTISSGKDTKIVITSTPLGLNHFYKFWTEAEQGLNGFVPINAHYSEHPDRDQKWADEQLAILGRLKFNQEVLTAFLGSSSTLVSAEYLAKFTIKKPYYDKDGLMLYEPPFKGKLAEDGKTFIEQPGLYAMTVDTSKGVGNDYSTFSIFKIDQVPYKLVGRYRNNTISPLLFPNVIYKMATEFNDAWVLIELNSSEQVPYILQQELEYENIVYVTRGKTGQIISGGFGNTSRTQFGVITDKKVKRVGCSMIKTLIEEGKIEINDYETINEFHTFIESKGSYAADDGKTDDLVMNHVLFGWMVSNNYFKELTDINLRENLYKARMQAIEDEVLPTGYFTDGREETTESGWVDYQIG
jgi:hypothetical protein